MPGRVAISAQRRHPGRQLGIAIEQAPARIGQVEVLPVIKRREERRRVVRVGILVLLHDQLRLHEEPCAPGVVVVQV